MQTKLNPDDERYKGMIAGRSADVVSDLKAKLKYGHLLIRHRRTKE